MVRGVAEGNGSPWDMIGLKFQGRTNGDGCLTVTKIDEVSGATGL